MPSFGGGCSNRVKIAKSIFTRQRKACVYANDIFFPRSQLLHFRFGVDACALGSEVEGLGFGSCFRNNYFSFFAWISVEWIAFPLKLTSLDFESTWRFARPELSHNRLRGKKSVTSSRRTYLVSHVWSLVFEILFTTSRTNFLTYPFCF